MADTLIDNNQKNPNVPATPATADEPLDSGRRTFLKIGAATGGALVIGFVITPASRVHAKPVGTVVPNAWVRIDNDDTVTVTIASSEMGQGVYTAIPMLLAEELDADWSRVRVEIASVDKPYGNPLIFGLQATGGSTAVRAFWKPVREAGASARHLLMEAAAAEWEVSPNMCVTEKGHVVHPASGRRVRYGALVGRAATLTPTSWPKLKLPSEFKLLGKPTPRLDTSAKVDGSAVFGIDVKLPGLLTAVIARCPVFGGTVKNFDTSAAKAVPGVRSVKQIDSGIAVIAENFWAAKTGREALKVEWDEGPNATVTSANIRSQFEAAAAKSGSKVRSEGKAMDALAQAAGKIEAVYEVPYLAHACMEPMNCTAHMRGGRCDIYAPTQSQTGALKTAAYITGLPVSKIKVHTTFLGGGFGRRFEQDFVADAVQCSKAMRAPVKVIYTREDDMQHDFYRPATYNKLAAGLDADGMPIAWTHHIVGPSIMQRALPGMAPQLMPNWLPNSFERGLGGAAAWAMGFQTDATSVEGAANLPYAIPNLYVSYVKENGPVPIGFWRSVGNSQNGFITECFFDEVARAGGKDPYALRYELLRHHPRHLGVLKLAASKADWGSPLTPGRFRGIAVLESFASYVAQVVEVTVRDGSLKVERVVCAIDCGIVVNPSIVTAQMEGSIVFGLTAALKGEITIDKGRVMQSNFHDYELLRLNEMPVIEVHIVNSAEPPGGVGEPGVPPIAAAVVNAVFAATGRPIRRLPIRADDLRPATSST